MLPLTGHSSSPFQFIIPDPSLNPCLLAFRSVVEGSTRNTSSMSIAMLAGKGKSSSPGAIYASIPYIKAEVPIFILFRALGFIVSTSVVIFKLEGVWGLRFPVCFSYLSCRFRVNLLWGKLVPPPWFRSFWTWCWHFGQCFRPIWDVSAVKLWPCVYFGQYPIVVTTFQWGEETGLTVFALEYAFVWGRSLGTEDI